MSVKLHTFIISELKEVTINSSPQPSSEERALYTNWIEDLVGRRACLDVV
jgi:hypothetical protein